MIFSFWFYQLSGFADTLRQIALPQLCRFRMEVYGSECDFHSG